MYYVNIITTLVWMSCENLSMAAMTTSLHRVSLIFWGPEWDRTVTDPADETEIDLVER